MEQALVDFFGTTSGGRLSTAPDAFFRQVGLELELRRIQNHCDTMSASEIAREIAWAKPHVVCQLLDALS